MFCTKQGEIQNNMVVNIACERIKVVQFQGALETSFGYSYHWTGNPLLQNLYPSSDSSYSSTHLSHAFFHPLYITIMTCPIWIDLEKWNWPVPVWGWFGSVHLTFHMSSALSQHQTFKGKEPIFWPDQINRLKILLLLISAKIIMKREQTWSNASDKLNIRPLNLWKLGHRQQVPEIPKQSCEFLTKPTIKDHACNSHSEIRQFGTKCLKHEILTFTSRTWHTRYKVQ